MTRVKALQNEDLTNTRYKKVVKEWKILSITYQEDVLRSRHGLDSLLFHYQNILHTIFLISTGINPGMI